VIVQLLLLLIPSLAGLGGTERAVGFLSGLLAAPGPIALLAYFTSSALPGDLLHDYPAC